MIEERYVNFETAILLKEKGFDEYCRGYYKFDKTLGFLNDALVNNSVLNDGFDISAPTHQMVMAWLREVHNLHIIICVDDLDWSYQIVDFKNKLDVQYIKDLAGFNSFENAADAAILECLTNLI